MSDFEEHYNIAIAQAHIKASKILSLWNDVQI